MEVAFGIFDHLERGAVPLDQLYEERLQLLEIADRAGFFCYHLAEHHATPLGMAPSPNLFLTAVAMRTRRILPGPVLVYSLPRCIGSALLGWSRKSACSINSVGGGWK